MSLLDSRGLGEVLEKLEALTKRARYSDEKGDYYLSAEDWRELGELVALLRGAQGGPPTGGHNFLASGKCAGCGMAEAYFEQALSILQGWPEDSEKGERVAELKACKDNLSSKGRQSARP